jgi:hypothetical protein
MTTTFQKRQKEMKRMEKARMKAERRAQKKLAPRTPIEVSRDSSFEGFEGLGPGEPESDPPSQGS